MFPSASSCFCCCSPVGGVELFLHSTDTPLNTLPVPDAFPRLVVVVVVTISYCCRLFGGEEVVLECAAGEQTRSPMSHNIFIIIIVMVHTKLRACVPSCVQMRLPVHFSLCCLCTRALLFDVVVAVHALHCCTVGVCVCVCTSVICVRFFEGWVGWAVGFSWTSISENTGASSSVSHRTSLAEREWLLLLLLFEPFWKCRTTSLPSPWTPRTPARGLLCFFLFRWGGEG